MGDSRATGTAAKEPTTPLGMSGDGRAHVVAAGHEHAAARDPAARPGTSGQARARDGQGSGDFACDFKRFWLQLTPLIMI
jgi:hypothetical protein